MIYEFGNKRMPFVHTRCSAIWESTVYIHSFQNLKTVLRAILRVLLINTGSHPHLRPRSIRKFGTCRRFHSLTYCGKRFFPRQTIAFGVFTGIPYIIYRTTLRQISLVRSQVRYTSQVTSPSGNIFRDTFYLIGFINQNGRIRRTGQRTEL